MELGLADTNGILRQPWISPARTSAGLGWQSLYVSTQAELPYRADFGAARTHLVILHLNGPVTVRRGHGRLTRSRTVPPGGLFLHPAGRDLTVQLGGSLRTVHAYLDDAALREAAHGGPAEIAEELGSEDPLLEQLMLGLDRLVRTWEPAARTYADHLQAMLAAQLLRSHRRRPGGAATTEPGLSRHQLATVVALMESRLAEPIPLADLAAATALSVSQFARKFKVTTGEPPHRYLVRIRLEQACRLLRAGMAPIAEVAVLCGFTHQEHLTRVMRTHLGITPGALRASHIPPPPMIMGQKR